jgi:hypothetical protein
MAEAAHVDEGSSAPLLEKVTTAAYWDGCPGCAVERRKAASPGVPYGNFLYVWIVTLCTGICPPFPSVIPISVLAPLALDHRFRLVPEWQRA